MQRISDRLISWAIGSLILVAALLVGNAAAAEKRVALVVGNARYEAIRPLNNPGNDANDIAQVLERLGFDVILGLDLNRVEFAAHVEALGRAAETADAALFYYAGHAIQIQGQNFLIPTDLTIGDRSMLIEQAFPFNEVVAALDRAEDGLKLVFLDACRDNPFRLIAENADEGLAGLTGAFNYMISYATEPGSVAYDGEGRNSIYTGALLNHIYTPGESLTDMMIAVRRDVIAQSGGKQIPWDSTSLTRRFEFLPGPTSVSSEALLYQLAARSKSPQLAELYIEQYPFGAHVEEARQILVIPGDPTSQIRSLTPDEVWQAALRTRLRSLAEFYLQRFPDGPDAESARQMTQTLPAETELGPGMLCQKLATHPKDASAGIAGVSFGLLQQNATVAIAACEQARRKFPEQPSYTALLARATFAAGDHDTAIRLWQEAAAQGDLRAIVSLAHLRYNGTVLSEDKQQAIALYERAAARGSADAANNLAFEYLQGGTLAVDESRGIALLEQAMNSGSAEAAHNLAFLAESDRYGTVSDALHLYVTAAARGFPAGYREAARLLDAGLGGRRDVNEAADLVLRGLVEDGGAVLREFETGDAPWSVGVIAGIQQRLSVAGLYDGGYDGIVGPKLLAALRQWRSGGFDLSVLGEMPGQL